MANIISSLKEMNPVIGSKVIVEFSSLKRKLVCELVGFIDQKHFFITYSKRLSKNNKLTFEGRPVKVQMMQQGRMCTFTSKINKVMDEPYLFWDLAYPKQVEVSNIRKNTRVALNLPVAIEYQDASLALTRDIPNIVYCKDISLEGLAIEAPISLGEKGDEFFITKRLKLAEIDQVVLNSAILQSVKSLEEGVYLHGFKFVDMDDENHILITAYVYKRILAELGYLENE